MLIFSAPFFIRYLHAFCLVAGPAKSWEVVARFIIKAEDEEQVGFNFLLYSIQLLFMVFFFRFWAYLRYWPLLCRFIER